MVSIDDELIDIRILVADDEESIRKIFSQMLTEKGYIIVGEAKDGAEVIEKYKELRPDIVTLDLMMPGIDGLQALQRILAFDEDAKIIVVSALDTKILVDKALQLGAMDYIIKPFTSEDAMQIVQKITEDIFFSMEVL